MAYAERRKRQKGVRYRGIYKAADGSYRSAGTFNTEERALEVASEAERHTMVVGGAAGGLDPGIRATRTIKEYAPLFLRHLWGSRTRPPVLAWASMRPVRIR